MASIAGFRSLMAPSPFSFRREQTQVLATSAQKWDARYSHPVPHTNDYYLKCCLGGILSCGLTHLAVTPLDVAKCNMQVRGFVSVATEANRTAWSNLREKRLTEVGMRAQP